MARAIDADAVKFSISGLRYIDLNDYFALAEYFMKQVKAMPTLTPPNEPLTCEGCDMQSEKVTPCASCIRDPRVCDYYTSRLPEKQEDNNDGD